MISGEQITYTYDALNRLASAVTSDNPNVTQWGQSYNYDGFGNLTDQNLIKGTAPSMHVVYSAATNRQTGDSADYNGNLGSGYVYDIDNRLVQPGGGSTARYGYDANNKRVWRGDTSSGLDEIAFWAGNQKLCTYSAAGGSFTLLTTNVYFGAKLVSQGTKNVSSGQDHVQLAPVAQDRLGSMNGKFYPYGQERPSATTSDKEKFTGYFRDGSTGLDYADQRYEQPGVGRFMTPDLAGRPRMKDPGTWNRYTYAGGDPVNNVDPTGQDFWDQWYWGWGPSFVSTVGWGGTQYDFSGWGVSFAMQWMRNNGGLPGELERPGLDELANAGILSYGTVNFFSGDIFDVTLNPFVYDELVANGILPAAGGVVILIPGVGEGVVIGVTVAIVGAVAIALIHDWWMNSQSSQTIADKIKASRQLTDALKECDANYPKGSEEHQACYAEAIKRFRLMTGGDKGTLQ